jgi:hypothetical protein
MTYPSLSSASSERCADYDLVAGRCQLLADHHEPHAADIGGTYLTWRLGEAERWPMQPPPPWLLELPWAAGLKPAVRQTRRTSLV